MMAQRLQLIKTPMDDNDHALMRRVAAGDVAAYRMVVDRHGHRCLRTAQRMIGNRDDAEDIVQEIWLKLWRDAAEWEPRAKLTTWLYRVIANACIDHRRKFRRFDQADMELFVDARSGADEVMIENERAVRTWQAITHLDNRQRAALVLCYYEGLSGEEVATILGMKLGTLQVMLHRARKELQKKLQE